MNYVDFELGALETFFQEHFTYEDAKQSYKALKRPEHAILEERTKRVIQHDNARFAREYGVETFLLADAHDYYFEKEPLISAIAQDVQQVSPASFDHRDYAQNLVDGYKFYVYNEVIPIFQEEFS